jgi:hypothetical protein
LRVIEVAWRDLYGGVRFFDEQLRRVYEVTAAAWPRTA